MSSKQEDISGKLNKQNSLEISSEILNCCMQRLKILWNYTMELLTCLLLLLLKKFIVEKFLGKFLQLVKVLSKNCRKVLN